MNLAKRIKGPWKELKEYIRSGYQKILMDLNDRKIRTKTIYLYVFCVLIPVVITNVVIIGNTFQAYFKEREENINNIADSVAYNISSSLENASYVTVDIYANNSIANFLDNTYETDMEFFLSYSRVFENYVFYSSSKHLVSEITLYSDNSTTINGGRYYSIDSIHEEEWYKIFTESGKDMLIYPYYVDSEYIFNKKRMISVIRKLNFRGLPDLEKIAKLDLNYNKIKTNIENSAFDTIVYVCHGDDIIFTNDKNDEGIKEDFMDVSMISMKDVQTQKTISAYGFDFDIYVTGYKANYVSAITDRLWLLGLLLLADALLPAAMITLFSNSITKRVLLLKEHLEKVKDENFDPIEENNGKDEISELLFHYNQMVARMKNLIEYEYKSKLDQQELHLARQQAELLALYSQINPHFMFNVLESIRMRSVIKGETETSKMVESLAKLMRKSAEWGSDLITIAQEIEFTENYLGLQKYRFGDRLMYKYRISDQCGSYLIPSLVVVTFVENACIHGLNKEGHAGMIFITVNKDDEYLTIEIEDTGVGMEADKVVDLKKLLNEADIEQLQKSTSLGMLNASIRLKKYCGNAVSILIESEPHIGTCIIIKIPIKNLAKA